MKNSSLLCLGFLTVTLVACIMSPDVSPQTHVQKYKTEEVRVDAESCTIAGPPHIIKTVEELCAVFQPYVYTSAAARIKIVLVDKPRARGSLYLPEENIIEVPEIILNMPAFLNEDKLVLFHDFLHAAEKSMKIREALQSTAIFKKAYEHLVASAGFNSMKDALHFSKEIEYNPYFRIFDESSYTPPFHFSPYGHPYSSPSELFASALTIYRFFPDEFIRRFRELDPLAQETVRFVTKQFFEGLLLYNPDTEILQKLIPQYEEILNKIL